MMPYFTLGLAVICIVIHSMFVKKPRTAKKFLEIAFLYLMVINIGLGGIMAFIGHVFMGPQTAAMIGWQAGSPFQYEVGVADLAFGILAILTIWIRGKFWLAAALGNAIFLIGCAIGHIKDLLQGNTAVYNAGPVLYVTDFAVPLFVLAVALMILRIKEKTSKRGARKIK